MYLVFVPVVEFLSDKGTITIIDEGLVLRVFEAPGGQDRVVHEDVVPVARQLPLRSHGQARITKQRLLGKDGR